MNQIIFYHPYELSDKPNKGSEIRPLKMKEAFEALGFGVRLVTGNSLDRKKAIQRIKKEIEQGKQYSFLYGESSNLPVPLTDSHHFPLRPLQDFLFFKFLNKHSVPIGFFYRDLFWMVKELRWRHGVLKNIPRQGLHWIEWFGLKQTVDHLFIPSERMAKYFPTSWPGSKWSALYPGCSPMEEVQDGSCKNDHELQLFYVGGIEPMLYNIEPLLEVVGEVEGVSLVMCCREAHWEKYGVYYKKFDLSNVTIIHADSTKIGAYYRQSDLVMCLWPSEGYINDTMPIKIIESLGYEVPLLLLKGSESAKLIDKDEAGWVVNSVKEAKELLGELRKNPAMIEEKKRHIRKINKKHTWEMRAKKVRETLLR